MKAGWVVLLSVVFGLLLCTIPSVLEWHSARTKQQQVENAYQRFASGNDRTLYVFDLALIGRIAADRDVAQRVLEVVFTDTDFAGRDNLQLTHMPNIEEVVIYSGKNCDAAIKTLNGLKRLRSLTFADCGLTDAGFNELNHPGLASFGMSAFGQSWTDQSIANLRQRMPNCKFTISVQQ